MMQPEDLQKIPAITQLLLDSIFNFAFLLLKRSQKSVICFEFNKLYTVDIVGLEKNVLKEIMASFT